MSPENTFGLSTTYTAGIGPGSPTKLARLSDTVTPVRAIAPSINDPHRQHGQHYRSQWHSSAICAETTATVVSVYGKNLTDERELAQATIQPLVPVGLVHDPPRTYRAEFAISF